jgi:preprotein translocase subunit SecD
MPPPAPYVERLVVKKNSEAGLAGDIVEDAMLMRSAIGLPEIMFKLKPQAATALAKVTRDNVGARLAIILDDKLCSAPFIRGPIDEGSGVISGGFDAEEGSQLCCILNSPLPMSVTLLEVKSF